MGWGGRRIGRAPDHCPDDKELDVWAKPNIRMPVLANLNGIIQDPKKLRVTTMLGPERLDYICVRFAERVAERGLCRRFWDDDLWVSDPGTRSRLYIRHALLMSLHKKEASTEAVLEVFFGMERGPSAGT